MKSIFYACRNALDVANASLTKGGIHPMSANIYAVEPYSGSKQMEMDEKDQEVRKLRSEVRICVNNGQLRLQHQHWWHTQTAWYKSFSYLQHNSDKRSFRMPS